LGGSSGACSILLCLKPRSIFKFLTQELKFVKLRIHFLRPVFCDGLAAGPRPVLGIYQIQVPAEFYCKVARLSGRGNLTPDHS
jgi:hypothetical protein